MTWDSLTRNSLVHSARKVPFRERIARALANEPTKIVARVADTTEKAAARWKAGDNAPNAEALCRLAQHFDAVWHEMRVEACRTEADAERILAEFAERLAERRRGT